jgi:hypothetical protein
MAGEMTNYSDIHWQPHKVDRAEKDSKSDIDVLRLKKKGKPICGDRNGSHW